MRHIRPLPDVPIRLKLRSLTNSLYAAAYRMSKGIAGGYTKWPAFATFWTELVNRKLFFINDLRFVSVRRTRRFQRCGCRSFHMPER